MHHHCPYCDSELDFVAHIAAPGYGQAWNCSTCENDFRVVGDHVEDMNDPDYEPDMPVSWVI